MENVQNAIGREEEAHDIVTRSLLSRFDAVLGKNDTANAPLGLHWCLAPPHAPMSELAEDGHARKGSFLPDSDLPRRMWASSSMEFHAPIKVGAQIRKHSKISSVKEKQGNSGSLIFVEIDHAIFADDLLAVEERQTLVYRAASSVLTPMPRAIGADLSAWSITREIIPYEAMLFRYSALTFNAHKIHYDAPYTREIEGYPALVVHGPLIASLLLRLASDEFGSLKVAHFSFRGKSPAFVGQKLYLVARRDGDDMALAAIGADGRSVMEAEAHAR